MYGSSQNKSKLAWFQNNGDENFSENLISLEYGISDVFTIDVDDDGDIDVLSSSEFDNKIAWYENDGHENFTHHAVTIGIDKPGNILAADINSDRHLDIISGASHKLAWYENDKTNNFTQRTISERANVSSVFTDDLDSDGDFEIITNSNGYVTWYENDGEQNFTCIAIDTSTLEPSLVYSADINNDGDLDVISAFDNLNSDKIIWYENDGNENFIPHIIISINAQITTIFLSDLDSDGDIDIISSSNYMVDHKITWYENNGSGGFTPHSFEAIFVDKIFAIDLDNDNDIDIVSSASYKNRLEWFENDGSENFSQHLISLDASGVASIQIHDIDNDGYMDILAALFYGSSIMWYKNDGKENFTAFPIFEGSNPNSIFSVDLEMDGDIDVLSSWISQDKILWHKNLTIVNDLGPEKGNEFLAKYILFRNYPNPFNQVSIINYQLSINSGVELTVFNMLGQKVVTLVDNYQQAGSHSIIFDGSAFSSGIYFLKLSTLNYTEIRKAVLLK